MPNSAAAQPMNRSTAPYESGTTLGSPVEPDVVSMKAVSSSAGAASGTAGSGAGSPSGSPTGSPAVSTCRQPVLANSSASDAGASAIDGSRNRRPVSRQARISAI